MSWKPNCTLFTENGPLPRPGPSLSDNVLDLFSLRGKVASVTGSSTGIGTAVAEAFAQAGADVCLWYNSHNADDIAQYLASKYNVRCRAYKVDIVDPQAVEHAISQQYEDFGRIDVFVANAGVPWTSGPMIDCNDDNKAWNRVVNVDLNGVYYCARAIGRIFRQQGYGSLIFTSSISGVIVNFPQMQACYNAVKAAVTHFSKSLAVEWSAFARVNSISPGYIKTELTQFVSEETRSRWLSLIPLGREAHVKELCGAYLFLASDASTYVTGTDIRIDGGYTCV